MPVPSFAKPTNEAERLTELRALGILDSPAEEEYDRIARIVSILLGVPVAAITLIDADRQWVKAHVGDGDFDVPRGQSFCTNVVAAGAPLIIEDTQADPRFRDHPLARGAAGIRFYVGIPLVTAKGSTLGALCAMDFKSRQVSEPHLRVLQLLAEQVSASLEQRLLRLGASRLQHLFESTSELLSVISAAQEAHISGDSTPSLFDNLLAQVLRITRSGYGFVGEVLRTTDGSPYLKTHAITNIAWNDETRELYAKYAATGMEFYNLKTLFGLVMSEEKSVISNDPYHDPRRGGLPSGHPEMTCFLGIPLFKRGKMVGMLGVANRPGGYDEAVIEFLKPVLSTCASLIVAYREAKLRDEVDASLQESEERYRGIVESASDGVVSIDAHGIMLSVNSAASAMFGLSPEDMIGKNVSILMPPPHSDQHDAYLQAATLGEGRRVLGATRELFARRSDGTVFPVEISVNRTALRGKTAYTGIIRDVSQRREVERLKSEFISTVSHEIRTPLTSIKGSLGLLGSGALGVLPTEAADIVAVARRNAESLGALVDDILDLEKVSAGRMPIQLATVDFAEFLSTLASDSAGLAAQTSIRLDLEIDGVRGLTLRTDAGRLSQVLRNLVSNACKFSPAGGVVTISARQIGDGRVRIGVRDWGPGVPESFRGRIFQRFAQADGSDRRKFGGTGLGLSIAKALTERLGGTIDFEAGSGAGTEFFVMLPLEP